MVKALIIEDNRMFRETLREALTTSFPSMEIEESADGGEVFENNGTHMPDIIFMEIQLPQHNGLILTTRIKSIHPHIPIVIITGYDNQDYREAAFRAGADLFLSKTGLKTRDIVRAVRSLLYNPEKHKHDN